MRSREVLRGSCGWERRSGGGGGGRGEGGGERLTRPQIPHTFETLFL